VAVVAGAIAGSISLVGFGIDSFIEVTSGVHANRNVAGEERHVAIIVTRRPDAAEMFERS